MDVSVIEFEDYSRSIPQALDGIGAAPVLSQQAKIILKPNVVNASPFPVTTPPACVEAVARYCRTHSKGELVIAEGCGGLDTGKAFRKLGYTALAKELDVPLIDLDREPTELMNKPALELLREFPMPRVLLDGFLISIPVLKAHTLSDVTLSLKNMFGIAPAKHYGGAFYRKSKLHGRNSAELHRYIVEINQYRKPDLTVLDATVGLAESHLGGATCSPPVNRVVAGFDPVAVDVIGATLLGLLWRDVGHLRLADGLLGQAELGERALP